MSTTGGYRVNYAPDGTPMYRVPELKTEEQFKKYMLSTYGVEVTFKHLTSMPPRYSDQVKTSDETPTDSINSDSADSTDSQSASTSVSNSTTTTSRTAETTKTS